MQIISLNLTDLPTLPPIALTIGNYDGVHLGHQAMLKALTQDASKMALASAVMVFEPQPREFFSPDNPPARLTSLAEKAALMANLGVDYLLVASFDHTLRSLSAAEFTAVLGRLNAKHLVLGDDFRFGHDRVGDRQFLAAAGFSVDHLATVTANSTADDESLRISSTAVRNYLADGDLGGAAALLGRDYAITGSVMHGDKIGRTLDFPTANVALNRLKPALHGVYGADVFIFRDDKPVDWAVFGEGGVAGISAGSLFGTVSVGVRPSVNGTDWRLEVHLPGFSGDLYGLTMMVVFRHYLHGERHYASLNALKAGIADDVVQLLKWRDKQ